MTDDRSRQIEQAIADLESQGITSWTYQQVYQVVRGHFNEVANYLRERKAAQSAASPAEISPMAPASVAVLAESDPTTTTTAVATVDEFGRAAAQARHAARMARAAEKLRLEKLQAAAAPPASPVRRSVPYEPVSVSIHYTNSPPPVTYGPPPVKDTRPKLVIAREEAERQAEKVNQAERQLRPVADQITALQAREAQLKKDRGTVETVKELRTLKAALVEIEEELEILTRQQAPLAEVLRSLRTPRQDEGSYGVVCARAIEALDRARTQHFYGKSERDKQKRFAELVALVGPEDVKRYVTDLTDSSQCRLPHNNPPWK